VLVTVTIEPVICETLSDLEIIDNLIIDNRDLALDAPFMRAVRIIRQAHESAANEIAWLIARQTGENFGNDIVSVRAREKLQLAIEEFLR
jgi:hypothetical protein